jgi:uncharacterized protein (DUF58 family)
MVLPLLWVMLAALALVLARATATAAFAWVGALMLAVWALGTLAARLAARGLAATRQMSVNLIAHEGQATVEVTVRNSSRLPVMWLVAAESLPAGLPITGLRGRVGPLRGRRSFSFRYTLHGARRGYYQLGPVLLRSGDVFGLAHVERRAAIGDAITVFPRIVPITHARLPSRRPAGQVRARQRVLEDPTQVIGVRPYQHGDGLRRVHWRATAHTGRLQSKLFEVSAQIDNMLVLNLRRSDYPGSPTEAEETAELAVTTAASLVQHALERRQRIGLLALGRDPARPATTAPIRVRAGRDRTQLTAVLAALGRVELGPAEDLASALDQEKEDLSWGALVIIVTPALSPETARSALGLRGSGFDVKLALVGSGAPSGDSAAAMSAFGVPAVLIKSEADIGALGI